MTSTLTDSDELLRLLVENIPAAVYFCRTDADPAMLYVNDAIATLTGHARDEFVDGAVTLDGLCHRDDRAARDAEIARALAGHCAFEVVYRLRHASGSWRWVEEHGAGVYRDDECEGIEGFVFDITDRRLAERRQEERRERTQVTVARQLSYEATHDSLTGLINRAEFERRLNRTFQSARVTGAQHALCYLDLDRFKQVNDTHGHLAGDAVLRQVGEVLGVAMRARDTLARLGGDEFGVLLEHCTPAQAAEVATSLLRVMSKARFVWQERELSLGISIGVAPITADSESPIAILGDADAACYGAKGLGGGRVQVSGHPAGVILSS